MTADAFAGPRSSGVTAPALAYRHHARAALALLCLASPASAELGTSVTVATDRIFRGDSVSDGRPVASLALSWDDPGGFYASGAATAVLRRHEGLKLLEANENIGFARRLSAGPTLDVGVLNTNYSRYFSGDYRGGYTDLYAGLIGRGLSGHLHFSPNYFRSGSSVLYLDLAGVVVPAPRWRLTAHAGLLARTGGPHPPYAAHTRLDWRLGVARQAGPFELQLAWAGADSASPGYYSASDRSDRERRRDTLLLSLTWTR